jgi:hypothetical protein
MRENINVTARNRGNSKSISEGSAKFDLHSFIQLVFSLMAGP